MGLNLDPFGGGPVEGCSCTGATDFTLSGSEITKLTSFTGTMYLEFNLLTLSVRVLKEVND